MVRATSLLVAALMAVTALQTVSAANATNCAAFFKCADCTCSTFEYSVMDSCDRGCAWLPESGTCVAAAEAQASNDKAYYTLWKGDADLVSHEARQMFVDEGRTTCDVPIGGGVVFTVVLFYSLTVLTWVAAGVGSYKLANTNQRVEAADTTWLLQKLHEHMMPGDTMLWSGVSTKPVKGKDDCSRGGLLAGACMLTLVFFIPSTVWVGIGLPSSLDSDWEFGFFYPCYFVGGMGILASLLLFPLICCQKPSTQRSAYAITERHALIVRGDCLKRELGSSGSITSTTIGTVLYVKVVGGDTIEFRVNTPTAVSFDGARTSSAVVAKAANAVAGITSNGPATTITFANLAETGPLFALLQARCTGAPEDAQRQARLNAHPADKGELAVANNAGSGRSDEPLVVAYATHPSNASLPPASNATSSNSNNNNGSTTVQMSTFSGNIQPVTGAGYSPMV